MYKIFIIYILFGFFISLYVHFCRKAYINEKINGTENKEELLQLGIEMVMLNDYFRPGAYIMDSILWPLTLIMIFRKN